MRNLKVSFVACLLFGCLGPFAGRSVADQTQVDNLTFGQKDGGTQGTIGTGSLGSPYATVTLSLDVNTGVITVTGTAGDNGLLSFFDQTSSTYGYGGEGGIFGFGQATTGAGSGALTLGNCSITVTDGAGATSPSGCAINPAGGNTTYDGYGSFTNSVDILGGNEVTGASQTPGYAFYGFSFTLTDPSNPFTSLNQIIVPSSGGLTDIASHICETGTGAGGDNGCVDANSSYATAAYIGLTPEPTSYLLFGTGLLALGVVLRKKSGHSGTQV